MVREKSKRKPLKKRKPTKARAATPPAPEPSKSPAPPAPVEPRNKWTVEGRTEERRERLIELWGKSTRKITNIFIHEKFFDPGAIDVGSEDYTRFFLACMRMVNLDRHEILEDQRKLSDVPKKADPAAKWEFIARINTRIDGLDDLLDSTGTKPTAKVNAYAEIRQLETLKARVEGVDVDARDAKPEGEDKAPLVVGLVIGTKNLSLAMKATLAEQGYELDDASAGG